MRHFSEVTVLAQGLAGLGQMQEEKQMGSKIFVIIILLALFGSILKG